MKDPEITFFSESDILPYQTTSLVGEKVVVFAPHPDDETIGCGGAIAAHCKHGDQVKVIILTNGDKADTHNRNNKEEYIEIRQTEAKQAGIVLGAKDIEFWGYPDRELRSGEDIISRISDLLKAFAPTLIYCPSPTEVHPDHRSTSHAVWKAVQNNEGPTYKIAFYELGVPFRPNTLVDITPHIGAKEKAIKTYKSQQDENDYCSKILGLNKYRTYTLPSQVEYAEGYFIIPSEKLNTTPFDALELNIFQPLPRVILETKPLVSVIVRTYDRPGLLRNCLESLLVQTYKEFEVVLVNDGGEDVGGLIKEFEGQLNIKYIEHTTQKGRSAALNTGMKNSHGQYLAFLDDDDIFYPNHLLILVRHLAGSHYKFAYTNVMNKTYKYSLSNVLELVEEGGCFNFDFDKNRVLFENYIPSMCVMFDRNIIEDIGCFDEDMEIYEDWDYWIRVSRIYSFLHVNETTVEYRHYSKNILVSHNLEFDTDRWYLKLYNKHKEYINEESLLQYSKYVAVSAHEKCVEIQSLEKLISNRDENIKLLGQTIEKKNILLNNVYSSMGWQVLNNINILINKCSPPGTKRRKWYDKVMNGIKFVLRHN